MIVKFTGEPPRFGAPAHRAGPTGGPRRVDEARPGLVVRDLWATLPEAVREDCLARRRVTVRGAARGDAEPARRQWAPLRPVVLDAAVYRQWGAVAAELSRLAAAACGRRASTLGELHRALRFPHELPLMDPDRPVSARDLTRYARPDFLLERGRPRLLELNNGARLGGDAATPRLAQGYAELCPSAGLYPPPSTVTARSDALVRLLGRRPGDRRPGRLLVPGYWTVDGGGVRQHHSEVKPAVVADAQRVGLQVVRADLADLRLDGARRLLAGGVPIDLVLLHWTRWSCIVDDGGGLEMLCAADRAGTVEFFPRPESILVSSKAVLAWLCEDAETGVLDEGEQDLVGDYLPRTVCFGLPGGPVPVPVGGPGMSVEHRAGLVAKPVVGKSGGGVVFGAQASREQWAAATDLAAAEAPVVVQQRVEADLVRLPFLDRRSRREVTAEVPAVFSPFLVDGRPASVAVRHPGPGAPDDHVVISIGRGAGQNAVVLHDGAPAPASEQ